MPEEPATRAAAPGESPTAAPGESPAATSGESPAAASSESPAVTRDEVAHLARLARLAVTEEELDLFAGQLDVILRSIARISEVAAADIEPTSHAVPLQNVLRPDEVAPCLPRDAVLAGAPAVEDDRFRVPQILGEEE